MEYEMKRVYVECPYSQKDECKRLGGKWDDIKRKWYFMEEDDGFEDEMIYNFKVIKPQSKEVKKDYTDIFLECSFKDKDKLKSIGGKWHGKKKMWFIALEQENYTETEWNGFKVLETKQIKA